MRARDKVIYKGKQGSVSNSFGRSHFVLELKRKEDIKPKKMFVLCIYGKNKTC